MVSSRGLDICEIKMILFSSAILVSVSREILLTQELFHWCLYNKPRSATSSMPVNSQKPFFTGFFLTCPYTNLPFLLVNSCHCSFKIVPSDFTTYTVQLGVSFWHYIVYLLLAFLYCSFSCILR